MAFDSSLLPIITSEDISRDPDQASYKINLMVDKIESTWSYIYPVGSYYETSDSDFDPSRTWGGDWEEVVAGRWHRIA